MASWSVLYRGLSRNTADELQGTRSEKSSQGAILVQPKQMEVGCICCPVQCNNEGGRGVGIVGKRGRKSGIKKKGNLYLPIFLLFMELQGKLHFSKILTKR